MASGTPETGTLIISALLILALAFAGYWIFAYAETDGAPVNLLPWLGVAAAIVLVGLVAVIARGGGPPKR